MQLAGATFFDFITAFFDSIKNFMHIFYTRTVAIDTVKIDFSFLLAVFLMLALSFGLKFAVESLEFVEKQYDSFYSKFKQKAEHLFNFNLEQQYLHEESQNNNVLFLIKICTSNMLKDSYFNKDITEGVEEKQAEVITKLSQEVSNRIKCQKKSSTSELLISFNPFENIDNAAYELQTIINELKLKYKEEKWKIDFFIGVETYAKEAEMAAKLLNLKKLIRLGLKGEIACLSTFKQRYSLLKSPKYKIEGKGLYTINDKEETVFCVERIISA